MTETRKLDIPYTRVGRYLLAFLGTSLAAIGCGDDHTVEDRMTPAPDAPMEAEPGGTPDPAEPRPIEIAGLWETNFGSLMEVDGNGFGDAALVQYDNDRNFAVTQNPEDDDFNPGKFNRVVWTEPNDDRFFLCTIAFGLDSAEEAASGAEAPDASDPGSGGCGGFAWTEAYAPLEIRGIWATNFGSTSILSSTTWDGDAVVAFDNRENFAVTQTPDDAEFNPGKFNRVVWTDAGNEPLYVCTIAFGLDAVEDALEATEVPDATDPESGGCGGFSWTGLAPAALPYAENVMSFEPGTGAGHGADALPTVVQGPPMGRGTAEGSLDVLSLGAGGTIVLDFGSRTIVDRPGFDFIIFENAFWPSDDPEAVFAELAEVSVSADGEEWHTFTCDVDDGEAGSWPGCAGWNPTLEFDPDYVLPLDVNRTGGDGFDLAELELEEARYVRIQDLSPAGTAPTGGFDLDAVGIVHVGGQ